MAPAATADIGTGSKPNNNGGGGVKPTLDFDVAAYTAACQAVAGPNANPRAKFVLDSLMKHLHRFILETDLTLDEWKTACDVLVASGKLSDEKRNEMILISDVLGIESLLDTLTFERLKQGDGEGEPAAKEQGAAAAPDKAALLKPTDTAILGPFFVENAPRYPNGSDIVMDHNLKSSDGKVGVTTYMYGTVRDTEGNPVPGAEIDVWHTAPNGFYEQQDPEQPDYNNRGKFTTDKDGSYALRCLVPTPYPIPFDGGAGDILRALDRSPMRPAHIHLYIRVPGYQPLITQIFDKKCPHMGSDAVFADNKANLVVEFVQAHSAPAKEYGVDTELEYNIVLAKEASVAA